MKPIRVDVRLRNNRLVELREALGLTVKQAAEKIGISRTSLCDLEGMRRSPIMKKGAVVWKEIADRVSSFYGVSLDDLFPDVVLKVLKTRGHFTVDEQEVHALIGYDPDAAPALPDAAVEQDELKFRIGQVLSTLTPREATVLSLRFGIGDGGDGVTLGEVGETMGCGSERIRQIEAKAIRKLRHSSRSKYLKEFLGRNP